MARIEPKIICLYHAFNICPYQMTGLRRWEICINEKEVNHEDQNKKKNKGIIN